MVLTKALNQMLKVQPSLSIVLVNNGSDISQFNSVPYQAFHSFEFIHSDTNKGSAWGFGEGIKRAIEKSDCDMILLLDDDNLISENCISELEKSWEQIGTHLSSVDYAVMALRKDRNYLQQIANGADPKHYFPMPNEFLGFSLIKAWNKLFGKKSIRKAIVEGELISIPCAPYGGLLFHKNLIERIGLPDERFFVYADDFEFTFRLTKQGGSIYLVPNAQIHDLTESWQYNSSRSIVKPQFLFPKNALVYMAVRNFIYFQNQNFVKSTFKFQLNRMAYTVFLLLIAIFTLRMKQFKSFQRAVKSGLTGDFSNEIYLK